MLIGHGTDYVMDETDGRQGLLFNRKRLGPAPALRLEDTFRRTLHAALLLEADPALAGTLKFTTDELLFRINDRLAAPNTAQTFAAVRPELEAFCKDAFQGAAVELTHLPSPRTLFSVEITPRPAPTLQALLAHLGAPA